MSDSSGAPLHAALFVVGWTVMVTAMMLPTALPLFGAFGRIVRRRPERRRLLLSLGAGFVGVWAAFGYLLVWADRVVHLVVERFRVVADRPQLIAAALLAAAGLYQFSELKRRCLTRCRSPLSFITPRWSGDSAGGDALRIGVNYGVSCLGCCWALMVVVFGLGTANVAVMLAFGLLMTVEKNVPRARRLTPVLGAVLVVGGTAISLASLT